MAFSSKIKGNHHLQGNVQMYNVRFEHGVPGKALSLEMLNLYHLTAWVIIPATQAGALSERNIGCASFDALGTC